MTGAESREESSITAPRALAMVLLQLAASQAEIGPFAARGREAPQVAAGRYRAAAARHATMRRPRLTA